MNILFLCTGNSCRSQMAEGWAKALKRDAFRAWSAGVEVHGLNRRAVQVMAEAGVDISSHRSKHVEELRNITFDYIITVCGHAHETCPMFFGNGKIIHRGFEDPPKMAEAYETEEEKLACYRKVRDEIRDFIETLPESIEQVSQT